MILYQSDCFVIKRDASIRGMVQEWLPGATITDAIFMREMKAFLALMKKEVPENALWLHQHFNYQVSPEFYEWIETEINHVAKQLGVRRLAFVVNWDFVQHAAVMDFFAETRSVFAPRYFATAEDARRWLTGAPQPDAILQPDQFSFQLEKIADQRVRACIEHPMNALPKVMHILYKLQSQLEFMRQHQNKYSQLTFREKEVLRLIALGYTNKEVAQRLSISVHTIRTHRNNLFEKLEISHFSDVIDYAQAFDLI